ncbi:MAG: NADH-quinone oxidoreductase subunit I [Saprospiraceae bacterium]|nr:NADH-quinone oxidoreductase subunit I [Saprospiraceae bacterium]MCB0543247.1 NADH-quinone oxidoreductase subunit I [Saprospiraceae bacterium]MCB0573896.1 NADH-quinone oxidoreductase subunit I [Saprospiraceae bacterium]MCB9305599.1 NADH-quinone oxidoreductase subunit I [Lewinellaceae bacterium]MCB9355005.1 NADH-quinone oxidoreductase subunit I [Lewinellaceae bacterium]
MQALTNRSKNVVNKKMTFMERIYLPAILKGMWTTLKHFFRKKNTVAYPDVKRPFAPVYRGWHVLKRDAQGRENCTACGLCAVACPAEAITMVAAERQKGEEHLYREEKYASVYEINMLRCIFCGLCEEACPKEAIFLTDRIVPADYVRQNFIFGKDLLVEGIDPANRIDVTKRQKHIQEHKTAATIQ